MSISVQTGSNQGTLSSGTTTIIASPLSGTERNVRTCIITNTDSVNALVTVNLAVGAGSYNVWTGTVSPGDTWIFGSGDVLVLDSTKMLTAALAAPYATKPLQFITNWLDSTQI